jgi:hypothetical protein
MSRFSASDAAISGFRFIQREPRTVMIWAGALFVCELVYGLLVAGLAGKELTAVRAFQEANNADPEQALAMLPAVSLIFMVSLIVFVAVAAVMFSAAYRAQFHEESRRYGYIRFGRDELRFGQLIGVWIVLVLGYSFVVLFTYLILSGLGNSLPYILQVIYFLFTLALLISAFVYPIVRLSFSMPMTYHDHHIRLFESWNATRGHVWPLLGAFFLSAVFIAILWASAWFLVSLIAIVIALAAHLPLTTFSHDLSIDRSSLAAYLRPLSILAALINSVLAAGSLAIFCAPVAEAYRELEGEGPAAA